MTVSLSIKNVPDDLAERLRARAERNRRSLQRELLSILELASVEVARPVSVGSARLPATEHISIDEAFARARRLFPSGTSSSTELIRAMRDGRYSLDPASKARRLKSGVR